MLGLIISMATHGAGEQGMLGLIISMATHGAGEQGMLGLIISMATLGAGEQGMLEQISGFNRPCLRPSILERPRSIGSCHGVPPPLPAGRAADGLVKVQVALGNIASKRERIKILYKKIEDLIKYLDPQYIDRMAVPDAMKLQFILAEEQFILSQAALLEQLLLTMLPNCSVLLKSTYSSRLRSRWHSEAVWPPSDAERERHDHHPTTVPFPVQSEFITSNKSKIMQHRMYQHLHADIRTMFDGMLHTAKEIMEKNYTPGEMCRQ
ncbi:dynactin subunit 3 [Eretmochelys imbricata]